VEDRLFGGHAQVIRFRCWPWRSFMLIELNTFSTATLTGTPGLSSLLAPLSVDLRNSHGPGWTPWCRSQEPGVRSLHTWIVYKNTGVLAHNVTHPPSSAFHLAYLSPARRLSMTTFNYTLFFTGRDDPRGCIIIGEDTKPIYFCFETAEKSVSCARTIVSRV